MKIAPRSGYRRANVRGALRDGGARLKLKTCSDVYFHVDEAEETVGAYSKCHGRLMDCQLRTDN